MGFGTNKIGVQIGIYQETQIPRVKTNKCSMANQYSIQEEINSLLHKKRDINNTPKERLFMFLQHIVPCTQKEWGHETSHKFKTS